MTRVCKVLMQSCPQCNCVETWRVSKRKCREIGELPSMMWKRSIVQATADNVRVVATLTGLLMLLACACRSEAAELVIEIPGSGVDEDSGGGEYRLDYYPPHGSPEPNFRVPARASTINFRGLPGTKYHFMLYYSNATFHDLLTWNQTIITAPEPPTNLSVTLGRNKQATISWARPENGGYTGFRFKVIPLPERTEGGARNITIEGSGNWTYALRDLFPGATYQIHAFTLLHDKESVAYASRNFTTKPNTPGKFIVWFRNETTLLVLWQPPYPSGAYTHYKVSIEPADARDSELYVEKEGEPPGPAQAAFKGLVPGRAYNISVQTVSEPQISAPTTAQYRTVPLRPRNVTAPLQDLRETAFRVTWLPPLDLSEFEKYQVTVSGSGGGGGGGGGGRRLAPVLRYRNETPSCWFEGLEPGAHYTVTVKTMSGKVTSWPATADLTLKPLPVRALQWRLADADAGVLLWWRPAEGSTQDEYKVSYHETGPWRDDSSTLTAAAANLTLDALLPGRNYTVTVTALSRGIESNETSVSVGTRPLAPSIESAGSAGSAGSAVSAGSALRLTWRSDVNSRQDSYRLRYRRLGADRYQTVTTRDTAYTLADLFPGAVYEIQIAALSHDLLSEPQTLFKPVSPLPAAELTLSRTTSNSALAQWVGPDPAASALGKYVLRYRTLSDPDSRWTTLDPLSPNTTSAEISNMTHGERYVVELDTGSETAGAGAGGARAGDALSESVLSGQPVTAYHTVRPNPVSNVAPLVDTRNMTIEWPRPKGRVEWYSLRWWPTDPPGPGEARARNLTEGGAGPTVRALIDGLDPGSGYAITIAAYSYNLTSDNFTMEIRTRPVIQSDMNIANEPSDGEDEGGLPGIIVVYTPTPESASRFDEYRFRLEGAGSEPRSASRPARPADPAARQNVAFAGLVPGRLYNITMWTVSHNVTSHPVQRQARLPPRPITRLNATAVAAREITLEWDQPAGDYTDFEVQYLTEDNRLQTHTTDELTITVLALKPYTNYTFTVRVRSGTVDALRKVSVVSRSVEVATLEAAPPAPRDFHLEDAAPSRLSFAWELPASEANGVLRRFVLEYWARDRPAERRNVTFPAEARTGRVEALAPGGTYEFWLRAETGAGAGEPAYWKQHMAIAAPPRPRNDSRPAPVRRSTSTVVVRFFADYFSPANGNVTAYTLVVCEEQRNETSARLPSWRDVHRLPVWPPYQVTEPYFPFHASQVEEFTIGSEQCEGGGRAYCNGPLKPGTRYYVKLRAFTAPDKFTDTGYSSVYTENAHGRSGQHAVDHRGMRGRSGRGGRCGRGAGPAPPPRRPRPARARAAPAPHLPARARRRLHRALPPHVRRLGLPVQRGVRGAEARRARAALHGRRPARQQAQEPVHEHPPVRPLAVQAAAGRRRGGLRLHQRELRARAQLPARVHRDAGPAALHARRLLAHVLGERVPRHRDADALRGEGPREVRPVLAVRHAARLLRGHRRHRAQREPLPRLDRHRADAVPRRRAARAQALPLHDVARLRGARAAHRAGPVRARVPGALPAGPALAPGRGALQRRRGPLGHVHHAGHGAAAAGLARRLRGHLRHGVRDAARARLDGADGAAVHLHPPVPGGRARGAGPRAAAPQQPPAPPQPRLRRRRGYSRVGDVRAQDGTRG